MRKLLVISLAAVAFSTSGCGVKPDQLDPPPSAQETPFPRTYPDPTTDPAP